MLTLKILRHYTSLREKLLPLAVEKIKKIYMDILHPNRKPWNETTESLARYQSGSLGHELYWFLKRGNINLEPKYESHDVFHVIAGYGLGLINEARLFFFLFGNGKRSLSIIGSMIVALIFIPEQWSQFRKDYHRGKSYKAIKHLDFENMLDMDFQGLMNYLKVL